MPIDARIIEDKIADTKNSQTKSKSLNEIVNEISVDARTNPEKYIEETEVPDGGE